MSLAEIKQLPVKNMIGKNAACFLWVTDSHLKEGIEVLESWGFKYHCCLTWDKVGGWSMCGFHRRSEFCLFGYVHSLNLCRTLKLCISAYVPGDQRPDFIL